MISTGITNTENTSLTEALRKPNAATAEAATTSVGAHGDTVTLSAAARDKAAGLKSGSLAMDMSGASAASASSLLDE